MDCIRGRACRLPVSINLANQGLLASVQIISSHIFTISCSMINAHHALGFQVAETVSSGLVTGECSRNTTVARATILASRPLLSCILHSEQSPKRLATGGERGFYRLVRLRESQHGSLTSPAMQMDGEEAAPVKMGIAWPTGWMAQQPPSYGQRQDRRVDTSRAASRAESAE